MNQSVAQLRSHLNEKDEQLAHANSLLSAVSQAGKPGDGPSRAEVYCYVFVDID